MQHSQVDGQPPEGQQVQGQPYQANGRPSLPPIYNDQQHPQSQYGHQPGPMVYPQGNGQVQYPPNYPQAPYGQPAQVYQQRKLGLFERTVLQTADDASEGPQHY